MKSYYFQLPTMADLLLLLRSSLFLVLITCNTGVSRSLIDRTIVTVNDEVILESDVQEFQVKIQGKSYQELFGGISSDILTDSNKAIHLLIEEKIIDQQVKKLDLKASDQEIDAQIRAILKRNGISMGQLQERLKQLGASISEYRDGIRRQIERKNLIDREIRPTLEVSEEQLRHFYMRSTHSASSEKEFLLAHILIAPPEYAARSMGARAEKIWQELKTEPDRFGALAKKYSSDHSSAANGGVLGAFSESAMAPEFRSVIPKMAPGSVAAPIRTSAGIHIVKLLEARLTDFSTLPKDRKDLLRSQLLEQEMERKMQLWLERKKTESYIKFSNGA